MILKKNFWKNKKVFITGHTGFKGSWLVLILNSLGARVYGYSLKPPTKPNFFGDLELSKLLIKECFADGGPHIKRFRAASMGRISRLNKPTSHITIIISETN